jgi:Ras GTPase-activating protein 1
MEALKPLCSPQQHKNRSNPSSSSSCVSSSGVSSSPGFPSAVTSTSGSSGTSSSGAGLSTGNEITEVRTLYLTVFEAKRLPVRLVPHPYCLISLNQVKVARTSVKCPPDPEWEEDFILEDIPIDVSSFAVILLNKRKAVEVASVEIELSSLKSGEEIEKCFSFNGLQAPLRDDYGSIRLKLRYVHEIIMPLREYSILKELIMNQDLEVIGILEEFCHRDRGPLAHALLRIFRFEKKETCLIKTMIEREIKKESETNTLFRMNSLTTTIMDQYMRSTCDSFLETALREPLRKVFDTKQSCELNPSKLDSLQEACANAEHLLSLLDTVVESIFHAVDACPVPVRFLFGCLQKSVVAKWPHDHLVKYRVVGSFVFLRLLCPAILNPRQFGLIDDTPSDVAARSLVLIAKCLQNLANLIEFGIKVSMLFFQSNPFSFMVFVFSINGSF